MNKNQKCKGNTKKKKKKLSMKYVIQKCHKKFNYSQNEEKYYFNYANYANYLLFTQ